MFLSSTAFIFTFAKKNICSIILLLMDDRHQPFSLFQLISGHAILQTFANMVLFNLRNN